MEDAVVKIPDTVAGDAARELYREVTIARTQIKVIAARVNLLRQSVAARSDGETVANATLAYRHLEDASMRLGKTLQALDGGVSVYDRATTVGA